MQTEKISVRSLVEFVLRSGSIDQRHTSDHTAQEGSRIHRKLQKEAGENYQKEVFLSIDCSLTAHVLTVEGRADGVFEEEGVTVVDEIKTSEPAFEDLLPEQVEMFWNQVKCYGHIYCVQHDLETISLQLTYYQTVEKKTTRTRLDFSAAELKDFFEDVVTRYEKWLVYKEKWHVQRNGSLKELNFPYPEYRSGQFQLAAAAYKTILSERQLFVEAPTGIGKTISTLFPSVKAIGEGQAERIFYLTAKTITRQVAEDAASALANTGMQAKSITLTAKDKICFCEERNCTPENCPFANGYYDRVNEGIWDLLHSENQITRSIVEEYARKHTLCPFEFSLDVSLWCDIIICDYNYLFDPTVYLRRFFEGENKENIFLIDEAHNLVDRSRSMYSASLSKRQIMELSKKVKEHKRLARTLKNLNEEMIQLRKVCEEKETDFFHQKEPDDTLVNKLYKFAETAKEWLAEHPESAAQEEVLAFYFEALNYLNISEFYDDHYETYISLQNYDVVIKQFCLDPSFLLNQTMKKGKAAMLFSASLTPLSYYQKILGGDEESLTYRLPSPFDPENQLLVIDRNVQTTYRQREASLEHVVEQLACLPKNQMGNYLFFFPSYRYLDDVYQLFHERYPEYQTVIQDNQMAEEEREAFLSKFVAWPSDTLIGFCVLGGIFSEGIDLTGKRLIGVGIVGVGLPQLNPEQDMIREYFDEENHQGFQFAYQIPGMNKVLQAAGRVIRDTSDKGVVLLLDQRFMTPRYQQLFPEHWRYFKTVSTTQQLEYEVKKFWWGE